MGGTDLGLAVSGSSSSTSGLEGNLHNLYGDMIAGGFKLPIWLPFALIAAVVVITVVYLVRK